MKTAFFAILLTAGAIATTHAFTTRKGTTTTTPPLPPLLFAVMSDYDQPNEPSSQEQQQPQQQPSQQPPPSLILNADEMQAEMQQYRSKYPTSEVDYLAAARARAQQRPASQGIAATQQDLERIKQEKQQQYGEWMDDWEASAAEAGNVDAQILLPQLPDDDDDGEGAEPSLLL